jgi:hypothetical protein
LREFLRFITLSQRFIPLQPGNTAIGARAAARINDFQAVF